MDKNEKSTSKPRGVAATVKRMMEVSSLTLNHDGTVGATLRVPVVEGQPNMGGGDTIQYDSLTAAPALGEQIEVTYASPGTPVL